MNEQPTQPMTPQPVYVSRMPEPPEPTIPSDVKRKHDQSVRDFPDLNLSESEYVISAVRRHPVGLVLPVFITTFLVLCVTIGMVAFPILAPSLGIFNPPSDNIVTLIGSLLIFLFLIGGYIAVWVYRNNKFFLTNESVIQEIQMSLFSRNEQTVSLMNIEDASFTQQGFLQTMLDYGSIRLSTEGDETTYRFNYVANPKQQIATLNNAVEAFKNGRPVLND